MNKGVFMTRIKISVFLVMIFSVAALSGQAKPGLGILPFTGGSGRDGETIANLFANSPVLYQEFRPVDRTSSSIESIMKEQQFQRSGLTDSDTIAELGKQMGADYVVSGHIARLRDRNLLLISIISVEKMEQIAGDHREYRAIEDIYDLLPSMAEKIIASVRQKGSPGAGALAVLPLKIQDGDVQQDEAELLAQILSIEIANIHRYEVLPRTKTIESVMKELEIQRSGLTDEETRAAIGKATNAGHVLAGTITKLGSLNLFDVKIYDIRDGGQIEGKHRRYQNLTDGIGIMRSLAEDVTGITVEREAAQAAAAQAAARRRAEQEQLEREKQDRLRREQAAAAEEQRAAEQAAAQRKAEQERLEREKQDRLRREQAAAEEKQKRRDKFLARAKFWGLEYGLSGMYPPFGMGGMFNFPFSIWPFTFFDAGLEIGTIIVEDFYIYPSAHFNLYLPAGDHLGLYAGAGAGYLVGDVSNNGFVFDPTAGLYLGGDGFYFKLGYSFRTPFEEFFSVTSSGITAGLSMHFSEFLREE
jgi:TolB-like protein